ncbi:hypothetical protein ATCC90586_005117 [Pythium insidiosum]|nr:hypothetical protein ATCC90586_005117 [Pythium insidiosum]
MDTMTVEILDESAPISDPKPRPKLRTRRRAAPASTADAAMDVEAASAAVVDETVEDSDVELVNVAAGRPRRGRPRDPDVEDAYEPPAEDMDEEDDEDNDFESSGSGSGSADFGGDQRRSTRTRRRRARSSADSSGDSEEEVELVIRGVANRAPKRARDAPSRRKAAPASRKRPRSALSSTRASETRRRRGRKAQEDDDESEEDEEEDEDEQEEEEEQEERPARASRPKRSKKKTSNHDDEEDEEEWLLPVEHGKTAADDDDENAFIIDKILARDVLPRKPVAVDANAVASDTARESTQEKREHSKEDDSDEERFLIKWKRLSYMHVSWETEKNLLDVDKNARGKIQRFREKESLGIIGGNRFQGDEYFNPEFREVDRILDIQDRPGDDFSPADEEEWTQNADGTKRQLKFFLVKWKAQSYDEVTWERETDIHDDAAVEQYNQRLRRNSMLADEMGLGKTVQTVTYVNHLAVVEELPGPYLIVAPLSTLGHWQREFTNWTTLNAVVYHGNADARKLIQEFEFGLTPNEIERGEELSHSRLR